MTIVGVFTAVHQKAAAIPATISAGSAVTSFVATTLPFVQYAAALVAIVAGGLAIRAALRKTGH